MISYGSDSSGGGDSFTETNVLLGYASKEASEDTISHLGGRPEWLDPATPPSASFARCKICRDLMVLLLQLNGDLPEVYAGHERRLYVQACRRKTCWRKEGSVRAFRGVRVTETTKKTESENGEKMKPEEEKKRFTTTGMGESLFGAGPFTIAAGTNPFSSNSFSQPSSSANPLAAPTTISNDPSATSNTPFSPTKAFKQPASPSTLPQTFAAALNLNNPALTVGPISPPKPWPPFSEQLQPYPLYYLADADYETLYKVPADVPIPTQIIDLDGEGSTSSGSQKEDKEAYESTMDNTFQKFADRLAQNPEQVIRYEFRGLPLLYSKTDAVGKLLSSGYSNMTSNVSAGKMPRCGNCGAARVFEVQLTPHAITELEAEEMGLEGMDWGTILVGVCDRDCQPKVTGMGETGYVEEWAGVQWEEIKETR